MKRIILITLVYAVAGSLTSYAWSQTNETNEFERITSERVGPYRPNTRADLQKTAQLIVDQTNQFRVNQKRETLKTDEQLTKTAEDFAQYMARTGRYGHTADDRTPSERARAHDYEFCLIAENIAYQFRTKGFATDPLAKRFIDGWKESPGHRENMLREHVTETGVAIAQSESTGVYFAVQLFGRPRSAAIAFQVSNQSGQDIQYRIGKQEFSLPSRYTRSHQQCRPGQLELLAKSETNEAAKPVTTIKLKTQTQIVVTLGSDGELKADVEETEVREPEAKPDATDSSN